MDSKDETSKSSFSFNQSVALESLDNIKDERLLKRIKEEQLIKKIRNEVDVPKEEISLSNSNVTENETSGFGTHDLKKEKGKDCSIILLFSIQSVLT